METNDPGSYLDPRNVGAVILATLIAIQAYFRRKTRKLMDKPESNGNGTTKALTDMAAAQTDAFRAGSQIIQALLVEERKESMRKDIRILELEMENAHLRGELERYRGDSS